MAVDPTQQFPGFQDFKSNVTFVPLQFFTVVIPHCSRGTVRIVGYALRRILGWVDEHGNPTREQLQFSYRELIENAGVSRDSIAGALREAVERRCLRCVQSPRPDQNGQSGQSGIYELCWDQEGRYTDSPAEFRGFFYPEAAIVEVADGSRLVQRSKAARKNIPNAFFDYLLPRERLSVIRVVGALMFYSIQWGPGGERKVPVTRSITELSRLTKLSRQHVHDAIVEARRHGYIEQFEAGWFDPAAGKESRAATYAIRWARGPLREPVRKGGRKMQSERVDGVAVEKGAWNQSEIVNGERSKMANGLSIKNELKNQNTATANVAVDSGFDLLRKAGFDAKTANHLAVRHSQDAISRQLEWLPHRNAKSSRLGLLRRAIEGNWPKPETADSVETGSPLAQQFASHYYASYHDFEGGATTESFPKDLAVAAKFLPRLLTLEQDPALAPHWGRRFGRLMREKHQGDPKARPNLSFALVLYGDEFLRVLHREVTARQRKALGAAKEAHERAFTAAYIAYLRLTEFELQKATAPLYGTFTQHRQKVRSMLTSGPFLASANRVARFENEESRLLDFAAFFRDHPQRPVLGFWEWDVRLNPARFGKAVIAGNPSEARS